MLNAETNSPEPHTLMEVLHEMTMQSRNKQEQSRKINNQRSFSMKNVLPNGDPPEVMMWGRS